MAIKDVINEFEGEIEGEVLNVDIHSWKEPGDWIGGELMDIKEFTGGKFENTCKQYLFKTDDGLESCVLGQAVDKQIEGKMKVGKRYYIKFKGQMDLGDGRSVNRFTVIDVTDWLKHKQADLEKKKNIKAKEKRIKEGIEDPNDERNVENAE